MKLRLHHIGVAVRDIPTAVEDFSGPLGYRLCGPLVHDPVQTAFAQFLKLPEDSSYVELVAPDGPASKLQGALKRGGGLNHLCYAVDDIAAACVFLREKGMLVIQEPVPAVAFPGRRIAWLMGTGNMLTELVEDGVDAW
jgi:methylmalonyl-CoA/ethylmalonyl-CoA epimerase